MKYGNNKKLYKAFPSFMLIIERRERQLITNLNKTSPKESQSTKDVQRTERKLREVFL